MIRGREAANEWQRMWDVFGLDSIWIAFAFLLGFLARQVGLPPMVGFLAAGFVLNLEGFAASAFVDRAADLGVTLLLFTLGLKLRPRDLSPRVIWGTTLLHAVVTVAAAAGFLALVAAVAGGAAGLVPEGWRARLLVGFALCFSSTVFAAKSLEDRGETGASYGRIALGILIVQDILAVLFMVVVDGKAPSPWALGLLLLIPGRHVLRALLRRAGHGELLALFGFSLAFVGAELFDLVGIKGDFGALLLGMLLGSEPKTEELARSLLRFKDLMLVGFFLSIGMHGVPGPAGVALAAVLVLLVPLKAALFFVILTRLRLRTGGSLLVSLILANYSEFGLIVAAVAAEAGWIGTEWVVILAVAVSISFALASPLNASADRLVDWVEPIFKRFERPGRLPGDHLFDPGDAEVVILGMGRVGTRAYDVMRERSSGRVIGVDADPAVVARQREAGRDVQFGDATDREFYDSFSPGRIRWVLLTLPQQSENLGAVRLLRKSGYRGSLAAAAQFEDHARQLEEIGVDLVYNHYLEAGAAFADQVGAADAAAGRGRPAGEP